MQSNQEQFQNPISYIDSSFCAARLRSFRALNTKNFISAHDESGASNARPPRVKSIAEQKQTFIKKLESISRSRYSYEVFGDFLELGAIAMHQRSYNFDGFMPDEYSDKLEAQYMRDIERYKKEELVVMAELLQITREVHANHFVDFLGEIASEQQFLSKWKGQFFTPYSLSAICARVTVADAHEILDRSGFINVSEPACGGGAMVIAMAEALTYQGGMGPEQGEGESFRKYRWPGTQVPEARQQFSGIEPRSCARFYCTDVSRLAFNMSYIQLAAQGLQAIVTYGNTISGDVFEVRSTPAVKEFDAWLSGKLKDHMVVARSRKMLKFLQALESGESLATGQAVVVEPVQSGNYERKPLTAVGSSTPETMNVQGFSADPQTGQGLLFEPSAEVSPAPKKKRQKKPKPEGVSIQPGLF